MKTILSSNDYEIQVSDEDFDYLNQYSWHVDIVNGVPVSVKTSVKGIKKYLHHLVLERRGILFSDEVDHKNRNPLNNQVENLRPANRCEQIWNRGRQKRNTSGFIGVRFRKNLNTYRAVIGIAGVYIHLGCFPNAIDAAKAYDESAKRLHGDFAVLNFPS